MKLHELKTRFRPFDETWEGRKTFEVRKDDRDFKVGDALLLCEWDPEEGYMGREIWALITYKASGGEWGLPEGLCVLSLQGITQMNMLESARLGHR